MGQQDSAAIIVLDLIDFIKHHIPFVSKGWAVNEKMLYVFDGKIRA